LAFIHLRQTKIFELIFRHSYKVIQTCVHGSKNTKKWNKFSRRNHMEFEFANQIFFLALSAASGFAGLLFSSNHYT
jgi:hypothetical protein